MRTKITLILLAVAACFAVGRASAQERYTYTTTRTRTVTIPINWRPDSTEFQRYTVAVRPIGLATSGRLRVDFEYELPRPGHWIQASVFGQVVPARSRRNLDYYGGGYYGDGNDRSGFVSGFDSYHRMWGMGAGVLFKNVFSRRGWYFSTGLTFEFFRVGVFDSAYIPYEEDGLTFWDEGRELVSKSYFKPMAQINIGKHMALSRRCFFDLYAGLGLTISMSDNSDGRHIHDDYGWRYPLFEDLNGFAYGGLVPIGGFRFGVLLWGPER